MAQKITGAQVEFDPNAPLIDVDTAIEDLAEDLGRAGRRRQLVALQHLASVARQVTMAWHVYEQWPKDIETVTQDYERAIKGQNWTTRVIVLEPREEWSEDDRIYFRNNGTLPPPEERF